jgi:hypothetical protein
MGTRRIEVLAAGSPALRQVLDELRGHGLREPAGPDPLLSPALPAGVLDEFLSLAVRECGDANLFGLALILPMCAFQRGAGYEALEYALTSRGMPPDHREFVAGRMLGAKSVADVVWAHQIVLTAGNTGIYHSFLSRHAAVVVDKCFDQLAAYLLDPGRGPGGYVAACVDIVLRHGVSAPSLFVRRWLEWLDAGLFDGTPDDGTRTVPGAVASGAIPAVPARGRAAPAAERPAVMYRILDGSADEPMFASLREAAYRHVAELATTGRQDAAWRHLAAMVEVSHHGAGDAFRVLGPVIETLDASTRADLAGCWSALGELARAQRDPREATLRAAEEARAAMTRSGPPRRRGT